MWALNFRFLTSLRRLLTIGLGVALCLDAAAADPLPQRPLGAMTGSEFMIQIMHLTGPQRERAIFEEVVSGNVPSFVRDFVAVPLKMTGDDGREIKGYIQVSPQMLAVGSDADFVFTPVSLYTATALSRALHLVIPTRKMVEAIAEHAIIVPSTPLGVHDGMCATNSYMRHHRLVARRLGFAGLTELTAGYKKNLILTNRLRAFPGNLAIFGWKSPQGRWIQNINTRHAASYADYSHGLRLISDYIWVDGDAYSLQEIGQDPILHKLISDEGVLDLEGLLPQLPHYMDHWPIDSDRS